MVAIPLATYKNQMKEAAKPARQLPSAGVKWLDVCKTKRLCY
jgi:hypothetical protein